MWTVGALAFCERKYLESFTTYAWLWLLLLSLYIIIHWDWTLYFGLLCFIGDAADFKMCWRWLPVNHVCQSNRLTQNMQPETWNSSIHVCSFVDSLGPRRFCGGPNGWSLKRVAWKQGKVWSSWWIKTGYVGWWIEGLYVHFVFQSIGICRTGVPLLLQQYTRG